MCVIVTKNWYWKLWQTRAYSFLRLFKFYTHTNSPDSGAWCQSRIVFWCFCKSTIEFNFKQSKQTSVIVFASDFLWHPAHFNMQGGELLAKQEGPRQATVTQQEACHMSLPSFIRITPVSLVVLLHTSWTVLECLSKYLHASWSCWEFPLQLEPLSYEIFSTWNASSGAECWVFSLIWLAVMILSWTVNVLLD